MDKYTKFVLTIIAVGIITLNIQLFKDDIITSANAEVAGMDYFDLKLDWDFKRAVKSIVQNCYVDGDYIYC
jgi:hypothetical protein